MPYKIHPGIGVARVGDSPTDWFVGPETSDEPTPPSGHYKDAECRLKRQAARFRVWEYDAAGNPVAEVTGATITWTVTVAGFTGSTTATLTGPGGSAPLAAAAIGTPALGEIRTQADGRLLVLSGLIDTSFDGVCDGPVQATVVPAGGGAAEVALPSWVVVAPPDFSPSVRPVQSVYDRIFDAHHAAWGLATPLPPSLVRDVYPLLKAARDIGAASFDDADVPTMTATERAAAVGGLRVTTAEPLPRDITPTQNDILQAWVAGSFVDDWGTLGAPLPLTPTELDRGPIDHCLRAYLSAWDFGTRIPGSATLYLGPFRFDPAHAVPGFVRFGLAAWQSDLFPCMGEWPAQVPETSALGGQEWYECGFLVRSGATMVRIDQGPHVFLINDTVDFGAVAQGPGGTTRAESASIRFSAYPGACPLTLELVTPLPAGLSSVTPSITLSTGTDPARLWLTYETGAVGSALPPGTTVQVRTHWQTFTIQVHARTIAARTTKIALVLDCSYSMLGDRGDGPSKLLGLKQAVDVMLGVARPGDGFGLAPFSTAALPGTPIVGLDAAGTVRDALHDAVFDLDVVAETSVGAGIVSGRALLTAPTASGYDQSALVVVTDGRENTAPLIRDVGSSIDARTFAIGIGTHLDVNATALREIASDHEGALVLTGSTIAGDNQFILEKYFLQILSEITNDQILRDPVLTVFPGTEQRVPFLVSELDRSIDAIVVTRRPELLEIALKAPDGTVIDPGSITSVAGGRYTTRGQLMLYRIALPAPFAGGAELGAGAWALIVRSRQKGPNPNIFGAAAAVADFSVSGVPCCALVSATSDLRLQTWTAQPGAVVGGTIGFEAQLTYAGVPLPGSVAVDIAGPKGQPITVPLAAAEPGRFVGSFQATAAGVYRTLVRASGITPGQFRFLREYAGSFGVFSSESSALESSSVSACGGTRCRSGSCADSHRLGRALCRKLARAGLDVSRFFERCAAKGDVEAPKPARKSR